MKGLELAREFYEVFGKEMLEREFSEYKDKIAVGLVGHGSECFGFDDEVSTDHDFGPGFCLFITEEDEKIFGFKLFRAYSKLPKEFKGVKLQKTGLFGSRVRGVMTVNDFYSFYTGCDGVPKSNEEWLSIPDHYLASATNGEVFCDPLGEFTKIREELKKGYPEDVRLCKLASAVFNMAQWGQYNYARCLAHGEKAAAAVALLEFVKNAVQAVYLLNNSYMPYFKWAFRGLKDLDVLGNLEKPFTDLLSAPYEKERAVAIIENIAASISGELNNRGYTDIRDDYLEAYAYEIKNKVKDGRLRNTPIML